MRILTINLEGDPTRQLNGEDTAGQNLFVNKVFSLMAAHGNHVDIASRLTCPEDRPIEQLANNLRIFRVPAGPAAYLHRNMFMSIADDYEKKLAAILENEKLRYDILHANYWLSASMALKFKNFANCLAYTPHSIGRVKAKSVNIKNDQRDKIEIDIFDSADVIHAISDEEAEMIRRLYGRKNTIKKISHGVDHNEFFYVPKAEARKQLGLSLESTILLFVGRFEPQKNLPAVFRAYDALCRAHKSVMLAVCGGPTKDAPPCEVLPEPISEALKSIRHPSGVKFFGRVPNVQLRLFFSAADVLVAPSVYEPGGLQCIQAVSCGCPVAATNVGGLKETIQDGFNGLLCDEGDEKTLINNIGQVLNGRWQHADYRKKIADDAKRFSWDKAARALEELFADACYKEVLV